MCLFLSHDLATTALPFEAVRSKALYYAGVRPIFCLLKFVTLERTTGGTSVVFIPSIAAVDVLKQPNEISPTLALCSAGAESHKYWRKFRHRSSAYLIRFLVFSVQRSRAEQAGCSRRNHRVSVSQTLHGQCCHSWVFFH